MNQILIVKLIISMQFGHSQKNYPQSHRCLFALDEDCSYYSLNPTDILIQDTTLHHGNQVQTLNRQFLKVWKDIIIFPYSPAGNSDRNAAESPKMTPATISHNKTAPPFAVLLQSPNNVLNVLPTTVRKYTPVCYSHLAKTIANFK